MWNEVTKLAFLGNPHIEKMNFKRNDDFDVLSGGAGGDIVVEGNESFTCGFCLSAWHCLQDVTRREPPSTMFNEEKRVPQVRIPPRRIPGTALQN